MDTGKLVSAGRTKPSAIARSRDVTSLACGTTRTSCGVIAAFVVWGNCGDAVRGLSACVGVLEDVCDCGLQFSEYVNVLLRTEYDVTRTIAGAHGIFRIGVAVKWRIIDPAI